MRVRVELGPKDAQNGTAVVALSGTCGVSDAMPTRHSAHCGLYAHASLSMFGSCPSTCCPVHCCSGCFLCIQLDGLHRSLHMSFGWLKCLVDVLCAGEPGTVAQKKTVNVVTQLVKEVQATLKAAGVDDSKKPEGQEGQEGQGVTAASGEGQQGELGEQGQAKKKQKKAGKEKAASEGKQQPQKEDIKPASESESASEEEQEGRDESGSEGGDATVEEQKPSGGAAQPDGKQQGKSKRKQQAQLEQQEQRGQQKSGQTEQEDEEEGKAQPFANAEELTDDFELDPEFMQEPEEAALTMTKKERMKAAKKTEKMRCALERCCTHVVAPNCGEPAQQFMGRWKAGRTLQEVLCMLLDPLSMCLTQLLNCRLTLQEAQGAVWRWCEGMG